MYVLTEKETAIIKCWRKADFVGMQRIISTELKIGYEIEARLQLQEDIDEYNSQRMADCADACADAERKQS